MDGIREYKTTNKQFLIDIGPLDETISPIPPKGPWWKLEGHASFTHGSGDQTIATLLWFWSRPEDDGETGKPWKVPKEEVSAGTE